MSDEELELLRRLGSVLSGTVLLANELKAGYVLRGAPDSRATKERAEGFRAGRHRPLVEAYSISESRLFAAGSHLSAATQLLAHGPEMGHAIAALARTALESSARVAWLLDPRLDGQTRGLRGVAELMYMFREESKMPVPAFQNLGRARLDELVQGVESAGFRPVRNSREEVMHFGQRRPEATEVIGREVGRDGELIYRELSGVAHGNITAHVRMMEPVPADEQLGVPVDDEGVTLRRPAPLSMFVKPLAHIWGAYMGGLGRKVLLYGWDQTRFRAWMTEAGQELDELMQLDASEDPQEDA